MKTYYLLLAMLCSAFSLKAQVAIGKAAVNGNSTLLDFEDSSSNKKGLVLPAVDALPSSPANGTFIISRVDKKIKVYANNSWKDLSDAGSTTNAITNTGTETGTGMIIGSNTSTATGVLVLESADKAVILPKIASPESNVQNPYPGMICYDTVSKSLAVYDGSLWSYWK